MSDRPAKMKGMSWINPYLIVNDMKATLDYYEKVFGFKTKLTIPDKDGNIMHAEMAYKDNVIMLSPECEHNTSKSPSSLSGSSVGFYVYVDDVDGMYEQVKKGGATITEEPATQFWGDRMFSVTCPEGHRWSFAQNVADFDPNKVPQ